jgi:hypothetical protein
MRLVFCAVLMLLCLWTWAEPTMVVDNMEDLAAWHTGGQKEATLRPETTTVKEGQRALRFDVRIDHSTDEGIEGKQYPKGWPRVERNPQPPLDLSPIGALGFDIWAESSRAAMPGSSLHIILRDRSGANWSANLGQLPLRQWRHFRLDLGTFQRSAIVHWQFFLSESDYNHGDTASFIIDNVVGYAAQRSRQLGPRLAAKLAALEKLRAGASAEQLTQLAALQQGQAAVAHRLPLLDRLSLADANALDAQADDLLARAGQLLLAVGAHQTVPDGSYCVATEHGLRKIMRDDTDLNVGHELRLSVAGNEHEDGQIVVRAMTRDIRRLGAECTDLTGPAGAKLPRSLVTLNAVGYVEMLKASYATDRGGWWPDPLIPLDWPGSGKQGLGPLADSFCRAGETQPLWVTVACPAGTKPGEYRGTITLRPEGLPESMVALVVRVRNFSLPLRPRLKTAFAFFEGEYRNYYKRPMTDDERHATEAFLLAHKLNPMNLYTPWAWPGLRDLAFMQARGLNAVCLGYCPDRPERFGDLVYYRYLREQRAWLAAHGLAADGWLYGYDEPHCRPDFEQFKEVMREVYDMVQVVAPGMPRGSTTATVPDLYGAVNLWIPQTMQVVRHDTLARQQAGDTVWTYVACTPPHPFANYFIEYAALEQRLLGWQTWQEQCTGFLYYATNLWRPNYEVPSPPGPSPTGGGEPVVRWPNVPWNPRPAKDFQFNGDGLLIYPHPDGSLLSTIRLEAIRDGFEDYDYLCLLHDAAQALKAARKSPALARQAEACSRVPEDLSRSLTDYNHDPRVLLARRQVVGNVLEQVRTALGEAAWQQVLKTEPPLSPLPRPAAKRPASVAAPVTFAPGQLHPWDSGPKLGARAEVRGASALATGQGKGWADFESDFVQLQPGTYAVRLRVKPEFKAGLVRVFLYKYDGDFMPLDLPTQAQGDIPAALLGTIGSSGQWEQHRYLVAIPAAVKLAQLYLQCYRLDGTVACDSLSIAPWQPDPGVVDDMDEPGNWRPGFPESSVARETTQVHQGDAALAYTVKIDHKGGEEKYPIGWPSLTWRPAPTLDWTGKQTLTFWVYATTSRAALPQRVISFVIRSKPGDEVATPLSLKPGEWQQVRIPLAGKSLPAVNTLHFYVEEAAYQDGDWVRFVVDDMRVE